VGVPGDPSRSDTPPDEVIYVRPRRAGRAVGAVVAFGAVGALVYSLATNPNVSHAVIRHYTPSPVILDGVRTTVVLAVVSQSIGIAIGIAVALARLSDSFVWRWLAAAYLWVFRGVPLLVQMLIWGNLALLYRRLGVGIPFTAFALFSVDTNAVITNFVASILALSLHEGAYMTEIVRAGVQSVDQGQGDAARALGMPPLLILRRIVLPQAVRVILPPTGSQFINMLKTTSLVSVIAGGDLLTQAENISSTNLRTLELLAVASFWYLLLTSLTSVGQHLLERRWGRGTDSRRGAARPMDLGEMA